MISRESTIGKILMADDVTLAKEEEVLTGKADTPQDRKLLNFRQAADALGISKTSIRRFAKEGILKTVETRAGRKRVLSQSITDFISGGSHANG